MVIGEARNYKGDLRLNPLMHASVVEIASHIPES